MSVDARIIEELQRDVATLRRELDRARRQILLIHPHLFAGSDEADAAAGVLFAVTVGQTGGSAGNRTTKCSFTYTVARASDGTILATSVALTGNGNRIVNAAMTAGTKGMAYLTAAGGLVLVFVDERLTQNNC